MTTECIIVPYAQRHGLTRKALEEKLGRPIKPKYEACHSCDVPDCVNQEHLWEGTHSQNIADAHAKNRMPQGYGAHQRSKTHCPKGHPYDAKNTAHRIGRRVCKTCARLASLRTYYKNKASNENSSK